MYLENIKILKVDEARRGVSSATGKPWASRNVLLGFEDETGESYISAAVDEEVWQQLRMAEGQTVSLNLRFRTRQFRNGFLYNDLRIVSPTNLQ